MGASISMANGFELALPEGDGRPVVAVIGDSTFIHSGVTGLINIAYNESNSTVIILDNSITGMTGHQQNPTTGRNLKGDPCTKIDLESLCHAVGRHCALLKYVKHPGPICADPEKCKGCKACMNIGCPAISMENGKIKIDATLCVGCGVCRQLCKFGAL